MYSLVFFLYRVLQIQDFLQTYFIVIETISLQEFAYWIVLETHFSIVKVFQSDHFLIPSNTTRF